MADKFRVKHEVWLVKETERVKSIILTPKFWGVTWTDAKLRRQLGDIGLEYSAEEIDELNDALHTAGVIEDVEE